MDMKFILIENPSNRFFQYYFIAFSRNLIHKDMYLNALDLMKQNKSIKN